MSGEFVLRELTPQGRGAVRVLELAGPGAAPFLATLAQGALPSTGAFRVLGLREAEGALDEALLLALDSERFELHLSGSPPLVRRVRALAQAQGAVAGGAGPDAAFEARARARLAGAECEAAARVLLDQAEGALRRELAALSTASAEQRARALAQLVERSRVARFLFEPVRVVIAGPVNAGKSTLFNALLGEERALVHERAGTTRDALCERARLGAYPVWLFDTAGERASDEVEDPVERAGQERARRLAAEAGLLVWLSPRGSDPRAAPPAAPAALRFESRATGTARSRADALAALEDPAGARARVAAAFRAHFALPADPWTPGAGVAFEPELLERLRALDARANPDAWNAALVARLGPADPG